VREQINKTQNTQPRKCAKSSMSLNEIDRERERRGERGGERRGEEERERERERKGGRERERKREREREVEERGGERERERDPRVLGRIRHTHSDVAVFTRVLTFAMSGGGLSLDVTSPPPLPLTAPALIQAAVREAVTPAFVAFCFPATLTTLPPATSRLTPPAPPLAPP